VLGAALTGLGTWLAVDQGEGEAQDRWQVEAYESEPGVIWYRVEAKPGHIAMGPTEQDAIAVAEWILESDQWLQLDGSQNPCDVPPPPVHPEDYHVPGCDPPATEYRAPTGRMPLALALGRWDLLRRRWRSL
jgi:hypothetical protein